MKQWDTADWVLPPGIKGPGAANHPCVIVSRDSVCANPHYADVNVLPASSHRVLRLPHDNEFLLDAADGMDWETLVRLEVLWLAPKNQVKLRKSVTPERRRALAAKLIRFWGLYLG